MLLDSSVPTGCYVTCSLSVNCFAHSPGSKAAAGKQAAPTLQSGAGKSARAVPKALLSFGDEMDTDDAAGSSFSWADSTQRKSVS